MVGLAFHEEPCECGNTTSLYRIPEQSVAEMAFLHGDRDKVVTRACGLNGEPIDPNCLHAIAYFARCASHAQGRSPKIIQGFIDMVLNGYQLPPEAQADPNFAVSGLTTDEPAWETLLAGIALACNGIAESRTPYSANDRAIIKLVTDNITKILGVLAQDLPRITCPGWNGDYRRNIIARLLLAVIEIFEVKAPLIRDEASLKVLMSCWVYMERPHRTTISQAVAQLFLPSPDRTLPKDRWNRAAQVVGVDTLIKKLELWLTDEKLLNRALELEIDTCQGFIHAPDAFGKIARDAESWRHVITALYRQRAKGSLAEGLEVLAGGFAFLYDMFHEQWLDIGEAQVKAGVIDLASWAVCKSAGLRGMTPNRFNKLPYWSFFNEIFRTNSPGISRLYNPGQPVRDPPPSYKAAVHVAMNKVYLPTLRVLQTHRPRVGLEAAQFWFDVANSADVPVDAWADLGEEGGPCTLDEVEMCRNPRCVHRGTDDAVELMKCGRCRKTKYCSAACQKAHWKEHKLKCVAASG